MKRKKGFIAISLIYSFFLVFLMLMVSILGKSANNRILVGSIKNDIREDIDSQTGFVIDTIQNRAYTIGEIVSFGNEEWRVMQNKTASIVLILNRSLTKREMELNIGKEASNLEYYGVCNDTSCQVRMCRSAYSGEEYCYLYIPNTRLYRIPAWAPTITQIRNQNFGQMIPSGVVLSWFRNHQGLQKVLSKNKLVNMSFYDGGLNNTGYVRLPLSSEMPNASSFQNPSPFHLLDKQNNTQSKIYNGTATQIVSSDTAAFIRPVIEAIKG